MVQQKQNKNNYLKGEQVQNNLRNINKLNKLVNN